jgi:hypothetical protein
VRRKGSAGAAECEDWVQIKLILKNRIRGTSLIVGVNNRWTNGQDTADGTDQTLEAGLAYTPSKTVACTLRGYCGRHASNYADEKGVIRAASMAHNWCRRPDQGWLEGIYKF